MARNDQESQPKQPKEAPRKERSTRPRYPGIWRRIAIPLRKALDLILDNTHKNRVVGRLVDAGMSKRNAESLVQEATIENAQGGTVSRRPIAFGHRSRTQSTKAAERP